MDYYSNFMLALGAAAALCVFIQIAPLKYRNKWMISISILSTILFIILCIKTCRSSCSFDCGSIDSLKISVNIKKEQDEEALEKLKVQIKQTENSDSIFKLNQKISILKYEKIAVYEMLNVSLEELTESCDGCKKSKLKYDSLLIKFNDVNEK